MRTHSIACRRLLIGLAAVLLPVLASAQSNQPPPPPPPGYAPPPPAYPPPQAYPQPQAYPPPPQMVAAPPPQQGGKLQLSAFAGWITSSDIYTAGGRLRIDSTNSWGAEVALAGRPGTKLAFKWIYYKPNVQFVSQSYAYSNSSTFGVANNYFLIAGEKGYRRGKVEPFFGGSIGAVWYAPDSFKMGNLSYNPSDTWYMAFGLAGGVKVFVSEKVALRLGIEMLAPIYFAGTSMYVGTGGSGMAVSGGIPTISGNFTAGLTFAP